MEPVVIISTGVANTASVSASIRRCGFETVISDDAKLIAKAQRVVLPGVGSFGAGMEALRSSGLEDPIRERVRQQQPLLAICLGMQLLCTDSSESPGVSGLGVFDASVRRLPAGVRVPQFGWNTVAAPESSTLESGYAYFANSYCVINPPTETIVSQTKYGNEFISAFERGSVLACQFHPELSGQWGQRLIKRWLLNQRAGAVC